MTQAASQQAKEEGKRRLRDFLESSDTGRQAMAMSGAKPGANEYEMSNLHPRQTGRGSGQDGDGDDI